MTATAHTVLVVAATVYGVIVIALIQGSLGAFIFWALGLPSPLLWGVVMFFLSMIPMAGAFLVWAPAALFLAFTGSWTRAIVLVVWGVLVVGSIDNVLSPRLVGQRTRLHELLVFFSVLGGLEVNRIRRTGDSTQTAGDALFEPVFVPHQHLLAPIPWEHRDLDVRVIHGDRATEQVPEREGKAFNQRPDHAINCTRPCHRTLDCCRRRCSCLRPWSASWR